MACRKCKRICFDKPCPEHGDKDLSSDWYGFVVIDDMKHSSMGQVAGITKEGIYAIKVR
jgi:RNA polymerase subunit RPABC4/transcription elongation factor Spt4